MTISNEALADKCEAWLQQGGASNVVDAYEAGYREAERFAEQLHKALAPFAAMGATGFKGSVFENKHDDCDMLYHHETGTWVTVGHFRQAAALLARTE